MSDERPAKIVLTGRDSFDVLEKTEVPAPPGAEPLYIDPDRMRLIPPAHRVFACACCKRPQAGWAFLPTDKGPDPDPMPVCSLCWLYASQWARTRKAEVLSFVTRVRAMTRTEFTVDGDGALTDQRQADTILAKLYYLSQLYRKTMQAPEVARG